MNKKFKILVLGENIVDTFVYGNVPMRRNPEAPALIFQPERTTYNNGGAGNVVSNLKSLSPNSEILFLHQKTEIKKTRLVDDVSGQIMIRIDENDKVLEEEKFKLTDLEQFWPDLEAYGSMDLDALVISDYGKGYLNKQDIQDLAEMCSCRDIPTFADFKFVVGDFCSDLTVIKINSIEYENNLKEVKNPEKYCSHLFVTLGENGTMWVKPDGQKEIVPTKKIEINNLAGSGDSHFSALIIGWLENNGSSSEDIKRIISYGNKAGGYAASRKGVVAVPREAVFNHG